MESKTMLTLSDLYQEDIQGDAIYVDVNPTSASKNKGDKRLFFNTRWLIDDELDPLNADIVSYAIDNYIIMGDRLKIAGPKAPDFFIKHWEKSLMQAIPLRYGSLNEDIPHVLRFPLDDIRHDLHVVDPDVLWKLWSKKFIQEIDCPQACVLGGLHMKYPCFVKICRSSGAKGVWQVRNEEQYHTLMDFLIKKIPTADIVVTEAINNVVTTFDANFYVNKRGELRLIGVTENLFNECGVCIGGTVNGLKQDELKNLLLPVIYPVGAALHREGFFGPVNVDVVLDDKENLFVVDINPRIGGTLKLMLVLLHLRPHGYNHGSYNCNILFKKSVTDVIMLAEEIEEAKVIIITAIPHSDGETIITKCCMMVFGHDNEACEKAMQVIYNSTVKSQDGMYQRRQGGKIVSF